MDFEKALALLKEGHKKWWFDHQSPRICKIGSDGVGHDFIHPADKLQAAYRNAMTMYMACADLKDDIDEMTLELQALREGPNGGIKERRLKRNIEWKKMQLDERVDALKVFLNHVEELKPLVQANYQSFDDALSDIWKARLVYKINEKSHPFGQEFKIALLDESEKREFAKELQIPSNVQLPNGMTVGVLPDADGVMDSLSKTVKLKETEHGKNVLVGVW